MSLQIKLGSLFDGSGGFPLAGTLCGIEPVWAAEVEPYPIAVTRSRFPNMKHLGDISKVNGAEIEPVDIVTFGSPCQGLSQAGLRLGLADNRSCLFMEAIRIIKEMREATNGTHPTFILWENVPGAFSSNKGEDFKVVLEEIVKIKEPTAVMPEVPQGGWAYADCYWGDGWSVAYRTFDAQYWGVPQRRRRIYLVADFTGQCAKEVLFERKGLRGYFTAGRTPWQDTSADAKNGIETDDRAGAIDKFLFENHGQDARYKGPLNVSPMLSAQLGTGGNNQPLVVLPKVYESHPMDSRAKELGDIGPTVTTKYAKGCADTPLVVQPFSKSARARSADDATTWKHSKVANTLNTFDMGEVRTNELVVNAIPIHDQATRFSGKRGSKTDGKGNGLGVGEVGDPMNTLTSGDKHAVVYSMKSIARNGMPLTEQANPICASDYKDPDIVAYAMQGFETYQKVTGPLMANSHPGSYTGQDAFNDMLVAGVEKQIRHIVRRLTPTECARLQGFPDRWGWVTGKKDLTDDEYRFWHEVRKTHDAINGKKVKEYTPKQMLTWYNKLWTDSSEYKMWGNGIALPNALYCMQGISDVMKERYK